MIESTATFTNGKYNISITTDNKDHFTEINKKVEKLIEKEENDDEICTLPLMLIPENEITLDQIKSYILTNESFLERVNSNNILIHTGGPFPENNFCINPTSVIGTFKSCFSIGNKVYISFKLLNTSMAKQFKMQKSNIDKYYLVIRGHCHRDESNNNVINDITSFVLKIKLVL